MIQIANHTVALPVFLAPMAGITDLPFRNTVSRFGAGLMFSEMVASREIVTARKNARLRAVASDRDPGSDGVPTSVQIAGCEAEWMAEAARICVSEGASLIDINMGCPAKKVTSGWSGSALMRDPDQAIRLVDAVIEAVDVPVTLKMRLGWDDQTRNAPFLASRAEAAGVAMVSVHGRTRAQFYKGRADWAAVAEVREAISIPLVVNGDVTSGETAAEALRLSGADAVMIGRGAQGRPWLPAQVAAELMGLPIPDAPKGDALADIIDAHYHAVLDHYGPDLGIRVFRKHLNWYTEAARCAHLRPALMASNEPGDVVRILRTALVAQQELERAA